MRHIQASEAIRLRLETEAKQIMWPPIDNKTHIMDPIIVGSVLISVTADLSSTADSFVTFNVIGAVSF